MTLPLVVERSLTTPAGIVLGARRYAFCFWLTFLTILWVLPIIGLSAKVAVDGYKEQEAGYWFWSPVVYAIMVGMILALDQSCLVHEHKKRLIFWKLKVRRTSIAGLGCISCSPRLRVVREH